MGKEEVGKRIKEARLKRSMSQTRLAELAGYKDKTAISKIESGRFDIPQTKLVAIAEALGVSASYLIDGYIDNGYYTVDGVAEIAQQILDNPNMRALFDAARDCTPEDMQLAVEMLERFRRTNPDG